MIVAVKLDSHPFYIKIWIWPCLDRITRGSHYLVSELGSINQVISFWNFRFLLFPQKFLSVQFLLLLDFAAYQKNKNKLVISFYYCSKYISSIKNKKFQLDPTVGLRIMIVAIKLDNCTFYVKIWIWHFLNRIRYNLINGAKLWYQMMRNQTFIGLCRRRLSNGKVDQINSVLAQIWYSYYWGPNRITY
jgi:hypothetical protein